jgi:hypothetical protein
MDAEDKKVWKLKISRRLGLETRWLDRDLKGFSLVTHKNAQIQSS